MDRLETSGTKPAEGDLLGAMRAPWFGFPGLDKRLSRSLRGVLICALSAAGVSMARGSLSPTAGGGTSRRSAVDRATSVGFSSSGGFRRNKDIVHDLSGLHIKIHKNTTSFLENKISCFSSPVQQLEHIYHEGDGDHWRRKIEDGDRSHNRDYHTGAKYRPTL